MSGWNPASATNTMEQVYKFGEVDTRRRIAAWLESLGHKELADRCRDAEYDRGKVEGAAE